MDFFWTRLRHIVWLALPLQAAFAAPPEPRPEPDTGFDITPQAAPKVESLAVPQDGRLKIRREELLQRPELLQQALSYAVLANDKDGVELLLPLYLQGQAPHDELLVTLAQAVLARAEGDYRRAVALYRTALETDPDLPTVRLALAQSLFENRADKAARQELERFRQTPDLAPEYAQIGEQYAQALDKRDRWTFGGTVSYLRDGNVNNAPRQREYRTRRGVWRLPKAESAQGFAYRLEAERDWNLHGNAYWRAHLGGEGKWYWDNHRYDDHNARIATGYAYKTARTEAAITPYFERRWYGTHPYSREYGVRAEGQYWLTPRNKILGAFELGRQRHDRRRWLGGRQYTASATWLFARRPDQYFSFGADGARKQAEDDTESYTRQGLRFGWTQQWPSGLATSAHIGIGRRRYHAADWFGILRRDREFSASVSVSHRKIQFAGITPQIVGVWQRVRSNHFFYPYRKGNVFIQFGRTF